jgi:hypothetical protein
MEEDNIRINMYFKQIGFQSVDCTHLAQDGVQWTALVNTVISLRVLLEAVIFFIT